MNTKNAIERIKYILNEHLDDGITKYNIFKAIDIIEDKLKRGEKYEAIIKEIKYEIDWHRPEREVYDSGSKGDDEYINETLDLIDRLEQKHFPKGGNR